MNAEDAAAQLLLMYFVLPLWIAAGVADWWCHRRTRIERTAGLTENLFHWLLFGEMGFAVLAIVLLEVNAAVLLLVLAAFLAHELTTYVELHYVVPRREVRPGEQMVHSFMEILPLVMLVLAVSLHWEQAMALLDAATPDFGLRSKEGAWPADYLVALFGAAFALNVLPLAEESWRCARARH